MKTIGIIGNGFVGNSIAFGFSPTHDIKIHDKDKKRNLHSIEEVLESDYVFVAVPTPMNADGSISLDIVHEVFKEIDEVLDYEAEEQPTILLRSTVTPGTTRKIQQDYSRMYIVFNPEFLMSYQE